MKVTYAITYRDFLAVQPPFQVRAARSRGFGMVQGLCLALGVAGLSMMAQGFRLMHQPGSPEGDELRIGVFLIGLAALGMSVAFFLDQRWVARKKQKHEENLAYAFSRIHCRDERTFDASADSYIAACECGTIIRPWTQLHTLSENNSLLILQGNAEGHSIPKSAFATEGELTEFRNLLLEKLNTTRSLTTRRAEYAFTTDDFRNADRLHFWKGGGWRHSLATIAASGAVLCAVLLLIMVLIGSRGDPVLFTFVLATAVLLPYGILKFRRRRRYLGPQRMFYSEEGLHLEDPTAQARIPWSQFIGYLEGEHIFLLYSTPRRYRIVPKRGFAGREQEFCTLLEANLPVFNYRQPFPALKRA